jgi:hypothetical protein
MGASFDSTYDSRFLDAMMNPDDLVAVVVGQTYVEFHLREMIRHRMDDKERIDKLRLTFEMLLGLALAFNALPEQFEPPLRKLASIRNKFAHRIDYELQESDVSSLCDTLPKSMKWLVEQHSPNTLPSISPHSWRLRKTYIFVRSAIAVELSGKDWEAQLLAGEKKSEKLERLLNDAEARQKAAQLAKEAFTAGHSAGTLWYILKKHGIADDSGEDDAGISTINE